MGPPNLSRQQASIGLGGKDLAYFVHMLLFCASLKRCVLFVHIFRALEVPNGSCVKAARVEAS